MTEPTSSPDPIPGWEEPGRRFDPRHDRRALAVVGAGVAVVLALGYFVALPLVHGSSSPDAGLVPAAHHHRVASGTASATPTAMSTAVPTPAPALTVRDPFSPFYAPAVATAVGSSTAPKPSTSATAAVPLPTTIVLAPQPTVTVNSPAAKYTLYVTELGIDTDPGGAVTEGATVTVNGKQYQLKQGQDFPSATGGPFQLVSVTKDSGTSTDPHNLTATFLYGEDVFAMKSGETQTEN